MKKKGSSVRPKECLFYICVLLSLLNKYFSSWLQSSPQVVLSGQANLKRPYGYILKISIYLVKHFPISIRVSSQSFTLSHNHR